jgi:hypothetical protein
MAITIALEGASPRPATHLFETVIDVRNWDDYIGVTLVGPLGPIAVGDRVEITLVVARQTIRCGMRAEVVERPSGPTPGTILLRTVDGPVDGQLTAHVTPTPGSGSVVDVAVNGVVRGPARLVERPLEAIARRWAVHQLHHLLAVALSAT